MTTERRAAMASPQRANTILPRPVPPRGLIYLASAWLVLSWILAVGLRGPIQRHAASYTPGVRWMELLLIIGVCLAWPLVRLSGPARAWPIRQALLDFAVLLCLAQVVVWPLRLVTSWPRERSAALDVCLAGWALFATALVALGTGSERGYGAWVRIGLTCVVVASFVMSPALSVLHGESLPFATADLGAPWWRATGSSPLTAMHALSAPDPTPPDWSEWSIALGGTWFAAVAWAVVLAVRIAKPRSDRIASATDDEPTRSGSAEDSGDSGNPD